MKQEYTYIYDGMTAFEKEVKRLCDFLTALICLIIFSPLFLLCYIAIKRDNDGPVIYKQIRIGRFGRPFYIYKFRSMIIDAEKNGEPQLWNAETDSRLTKTGKFLRDHHLDELPQFWNVLIGDMSFVGPRPERKFYINQMDTMEKMLTRLRMDLEYLEHRSWWLDIKIVFLTFVNIVFGKKF